MDLDNILNEVLWKIPEGVIDVTNSDHINIIISEMIKQGIPTDIIDEGIFKLNKNLFLKDIASELNTNMSILLEYDAEIENLRIKNPETGNFVKIASVMTYKTSDPKLYALGRKFVKDYLKKRDKMDKSATTNNDDQPVSVKQHKSTEFSNSQSRFISKIKRYKISEETRNLAISQLNRIYDVLNSNKTTSEKNKLFSNASKFKISVSQNGKKLYFDELRGREKGIYKILGDGTVDVLNLIKNIQEYYDLPVANNKTSSDLERLAKPSLGDKNVLSVYKKTKTGYVETDDEKLKNIFNKSPLNRLTETKYKKIYGIKDEFGKLIRSGGNNSIKYLKFSVDNNISINNVISKLQSEGQNNESFKKMATSIMNHKKRLMDIINTASKPSSKVAKLVDTSYATMFDELMKISSDIAPKLLKQFAEMRLHDSELAAGEEVYLPYDGSFPAGDKIVVSPDDNNVERVSFISIKYGKKGDVYDCPSNPAALQKLHPLESKRNLQGNYVGERNKILCVNDDNYKNIDIAKKHLTTLFSEINRSGLFSESEITKLANISIKYKKRLEKLKSNVKTKQDWDQFKEQVQKDSDIELTKLDAELRSIVKPDRFRLIAGYRNGNYASSASFTLPVFLTTLTLANQIVTAKGFPEIKHNKQYYDNGTLKTITMPGSINMNEWLINFRMYKTFSRDGGGAQVSYIGPELEKKYAHLTTISDD